METVLLISSIALLVSGIDLLFTYTKGSSARIPTAE